MNNCKSLGSVNSNTLRGLVAALAAIALCGLGHFSAAQAAEGIDYNSSRSNKSSIAAPGGGSEGGGAGKASPKLAEAVAKVDEIDAMVAALRLQLSSIEMACYELQVLSTDVDEEMSVSSEASTELLAQLEEAQRIFSEQIASLLDEPSVLVVSGDLEKKKKDAQMQIESWSLGASNSGMSVSVSPVTDQLTGLQEVFDSFAAACVVAGEHIKEAKLTVR